MTGKTRRLSVFHNLPSGGGIRVLSDMLGTLCREFTVTVHFPEGSHRLEDVRRCDGCRLPEMRRWPFRAGRRLSGIRRLAGPLFLEARLGALDRLCRDISEEMNRDSDAVLVHNSMFVAAPPLLRYLRVPSVYFCYEFPRHIYEPHLVQRTSGGLKHLLLHRLRERERRMDREAAVSASGTITLSSWMAGRMEQIYGISPSIVRPGVDTEFYCPEEEHRDRTGPVLSVGALWPFKGHDTALEAVGALPEDRRPAMAIVADREYPGYGARLLAAAVRLGVDLEIRQEVSDTELRKMYREAPAVLCCQRNEPYGLVPLEAMACGTPVIAVDEGGFRDNIRNDENGMLCGRDIGSISSILGKVLDDAELSRRLGENGRRFVTVERTRSAAAADLVALIRQYC